MLNTLRHNGASNVAQALWAVRQERGSPRLCIVKAGSRRHAAYLALPMCGRQNVAHAAIDQNVAAGHGGGFR